MAHTWDLKTPPGIRLWLGLGLWEDSGGGGGCASLGSLCSVTLGAVPEADLRTIPPAFAESEYSNMPKDILPS